MNYTQASVITRIVQRSGNVEPTDRILYYLTHDIILGVRNISDIDSKRDILRILLYCLLDISKKINLDNILNSTLTKEMLDTMRIYKAAIPNDAIVNTMVHILKDSEIEDIISELIAVIKEVE